MYYGQATFYANRMENLMDSIGKFQLSNFQIIQNSKLKNLKREIKTENVGSEEETNSSNMISRKKGDTMNEGFTRHFCKYCDYSSKKISHVKNHQEGIHEGIRYKCNECDYKGKSRSTLNRHQQSVHEGIRYKCNHCEFSTTQKSKLNRHIRKTHDA